MILYFSHPACLEHDPRIHMPEHPDTPERLLAIESLLTEQGWLGWERRLAPAAREEDLEFIHTRRLVESIRELCLGGGGAIDPNTFVGEASYLAALHAAGGACEMSRALLAGEARVGFCAVRPSGHHAEPDRAMGFCLFNNVAITALAFRQRSDVLFASIHQSGRHPGTGAFSEVGSDEGEGYTINLAVPPGSGEELWLSLLEHIVIPAAAEFRPDLILVSAGFDAHAEDPQAECTLRTESFAEMSRHLRDLATGLGAPLGAVLEGGYDPAVVAECVAVTLAALGGQGTAISAGPEPLLTSRAASYIGHYWEL